MISRAAIAARASEWGLTEEVVEKDYVLGWLLWGIGSEPALRETWIFKGGSLRYAMNYGEMRFPVLQQFLEDTNAKW